MIHYYYNYNMDQLLWQSQELGSRQNSSLLVRRFEPATPSTNVERVRYHCAIITYVAYTVSIKRERSRDRVSVRSSGSATAGQRQHARKPRAAARKVKDVPAIAQGRGLVTLSA